MTHPGAKTQIPASLRALARPIGDLSEDPENAREHSDRNLAAISRSLELFGQQKPIVITDAGRIVAGNGTYRAARSLGWREIACVVTDLGAEDQRAFGIADNRTAELATWDIETLEASLEQISAHGLDPVEDLGFEPADGFGEADGDGAESEDDKAARAFVYRVIVDCADERDQAELIASLERKGRTCRALMS